MTAINDLAVHISNVTRSYNISDERIMALRDVSLDITRGSFVGLMGRSGSGKTTLLNMIGGLDQPTTGEISVYGQPLSSMSQERLTLMRRKNIGFIFQSFALLLATAHLGRSVGGPAFQAHQRQRGLGALAPLAA